jgi:hypothetical protein
MIDDVGREELLDMDSHSVVVGLEHLSQLEIRQTPDTM